ncbi:FeoA domain protein [Shuttleworthella sp. MSX8B]|nr:FeoA family protein [Shuttleworthia satelles]EUB15245.1 FeoA domain protein [Shuttleworthia sp. MSX8B]
MMPLSMADQGSKNTIIKINGRDSVRNHLSELGFVPGEEVMVVSDNGSNLIVQIKSSRVAIDAGMANRIMV